MLATHTLFRSALIGLALTAMAWPTSGRGTEPGLAGTAWRIAEVGGLPADDAATISLAASRVYGSTGCNQFFASLDVKADRLVIGPLATTKKGCGLKTAAERALLAHLARVSSARRDAAAITLLDAAGTPVLRLTR
jgi:heat shock protein HslJ